MGPLGTPEIIIIAIVLLVLFGASRLPATAKGVGQAMKIFKKELRDEDKQDSAASDTSDSTTSSEATKEITAGRGDTPAQTEETKRAEQQ